MTNHPTRAAPLSADLIPLIGEPAINMLVVRLARLDPNTAVEDGLAVQTGPAWFMVVDVLAGRAFTRGETIAVHIKRLADPSIRSRNPVNQWNNLSMEIGSSLVLACAPERQEQYCRARAAIEISSPSAKEVEQIRNAYVIENSTKSEPNKVPTLVAAALARPPDLLFIYALDFLVRRNALGREQGASLAARALEHPSVPPDSKFELGTTLATRGRFFDPERKADKANVAIVVSLSRSLVSESHPERRLDWMRFLASVLLGEIAPLPSEADALRAELARSVRTPEPREMIRVLQLAGANAAMPQDKETSEQLVNLWRGAFGIQ